jgi:hypothetical protein
MSNIYGTNLATFYVSKTKVFNRKELIRHKNTIFNKILGLKVRELATTCQMKVTKFVSSCVTGKNREQINERD